MNDTIQVPLWIIIGQWCLLLALGLLVIIAYRQLGYLVKLREVLNSAGTEKDGLPLGARAPSFLYSTPVKDSKPAVRSFAPQGNWSLLLLADPECVSCQNAVAALAKLEDRLRGKMQMLVITASDFPSIEAVDEFRSSPVEVGHVEREVIHKLYHTNTTPFLYIIDAEGVIRAKRVTDDESGIEKAMSEAERANVSQLSVMPVAK